MKNLRKILAIVLAMALMLSLSIGAMAMEPDRVKIIVESENEITEFLNSSQYNPEERYTFVIRSPYAMKARCPECGYNTYYGETEEVDYDTFVEPCPNMVSALEDDVGAVYRIYTYSYCQTCGYETNHKFTDTKYFINCITGSTYWARTGQSMSGGYDIHECKSTWNY